MENVNKSDKERQKMFEKLISEIIEESKKVVKDYKENPSEMSGSSIHIHEDSPFLDENLKGSKWKRVIKNIPNNNKKA